MRKKKKKIRPRPQKSTKKKKSLPRLPPPPASLLRPSPKGAAARSGLGSASFDEAVALAQREADHNIYSQIDNFLYNELVSRGSFDERSRTLNSIGSADVEANNKGGLEGGSSEQQHQSQQHTCKPLQHGSSSSRIGHARQGDLRSGVESFRTGDKVYARFNKDGGGIQLLSKASLFLRTRKKSSSLSALMTAKRRPIFHVLVSALCKIITANKHANRSIDRPCLDETLIRYRKGAHCESLGQESELVTSTGCPKAIAIRVDLFSWQEHIRAIFIGSTEMLTKAAIQLFLRSPGQVIARTIVWHG